MRMSTKRRPAGASWPGLILVAVVAVPLLTSSCGLHRARTPVITSADAAPERRIARYQLALVVHKQQKTLSIYRFGTIVEQFPAVFGPRTRGDKRYEGDLRTPEGLYRVRDKRAHSRWAYFLEMDYPNDLDRARYARNLSAGLIPVIGNKPLGIGGGIGIHGSDRPEEQRNGENWTRGCIALSNDAVAELHGLVKLGTPVLVLP